MSPSTRIGLLAAIASLAAAPATTVAADKADKPRSEQAAKSALSKDDARYFERLATANLAEIEAGKLAQSKAVADDVKKFASRMVSDHGKMLGELKSMASAKGAALPSAPDKAHQNDMKRLQEQSGPTFDRSYMTQMVKDHDNTLELVRDIADKARDPDLKAAGQKAVPEIQKHLDEAKRIASVTEVNEKMKGPKK